MQRRFAKSFGFLLLSLLLCSGWLACQKSQETTPATAQTPATPEASTATTPEQDGDAAAATPEDTPPEQLDAEAGEEAGDLPDDESGEPDSPHPEPLI